ncbi:MAG: sigma-70 family RNA polymerase sigma factor [Oscillospiraceae bacterium]
MTNEELAAAIQAGGADDLKPVLYDRIKHLMYKFMGQYFSRYSERFCACGVEIADLRQECYPAFLKALDYFKPAAEYKFTSYLELHTKNAARKLLGINNSDSINKKPLDNATSLEKTLPGADNEGVTLKNIIPDPSAQQAFENALDSIQDEQTRYVLYKALDRLEKPLREVIVHYYFEGMTFADIGELMGVSGSRVQQMKEKALRHLRAMPEVCMLREEQHIESRLHFTSYNYSEGYFIAQHRIADILKRGDYLSYGKRKAIEYECQKQAEQELEEQLADIQKEYPFVTDTETLKLLLRRKQGAG